MFKKIITAALFVVLIPAIVSTFYLNSVEKNEVFDNHIIKVKQVSKNEVVELNLEDYLVGVLAGEMPVSFEEEALKAQAVVARTYALRRVKETNQYDVVDTTKNQVYLDDEYLKKIWGSNYEKNMQKIKKAVKDTSHECIFYGEYSNG